MSYIRRARYLFWIFRDLATKYTRSLALGFFAGFVLAIIFWRFWPFIHSSFLTPVERIGVIGEFRPETLPLSIQSSLSFGLTKIAEDGSPVPALADWWEATDSGKRYIFHIRNDITWHTGEPVTAEDVNYNIRDVEVSVVSPDILEITLSYPYSPFPVLVSKPLFKSGLVGLGEYKVGQAVFRGETIRLIRIVPKERSADLPVKEYRFYRTEAQAVLAYKLGEIDSISDIANPKELAEWGKNRIIERTRYDRIVALFFNLKNDMMTQKPLRQALAYALPTLPYENAYSPISKLSWAFTDSVKKYEPDAALAAELFDEVQLASSSPQLTITTFSQYLEDAQIIADAWTKAGVDTAVKVENSVPEEYQVLLSAIELPPDPDQYPFWHSSQSETNVTGFNNPRIDKLLEDGRQVTDQEQRRKIYEDFERRLVDEAPVLFLYYPKSYTVKRK